MNSGTVQEIYNSFRYLIIVKLRQGQAIQYREPTEEEARKTALLHIGFDGVKSTDVYDSETGKTLCGYAKAE